MLRQHFGRYRSFLRARLSPEGLLGLHVTVGGVVLVAAAWLVWRRRRRPCYRRSADCRGCGHFGMVSSSRHAVIDCANGDRFRLSLDACGGARMFGCNRPLALEAQMVRAPCAGAGRPRWTRNQSTSQDGLCARPTWLGSRFSGIQLSEWPYNDRDFDLWPPRSFLRRVRSEIVNVACAGRGIFFPDHLRSRLQPHLSWRALFERCRRRIRRRYGLARDLPYRG